MPGLHRVLVEVEAETVFIEETVATYLFKIASMFGIHEVEILRMSFEELNGERTLRNHIESALICQAKRSLHQL